MEHTDDSVAHRSSLEIILMVQKILSIRVSLCRRAGQPLNGLFLILLNLLPQEIQFTKRILGKLISLFGRGCQVLQRLFHILSHSITGQVEFSETVPGKLVAVVRRLFQPAESFICTLLIQEHFTERIF